MVPDALNQHYYNLQYIGQRNCYQTRTASLWCYIWAISTSNDLVFIFLENTPFVVVR